MKRQARLPLLALVFATASHPAAGAPPDVREALVSYWPLDAVSADGLTTPDAVTGNDFVLNWLDASFLVPGQRGQAFVFDGLSQYLHFTTPEPMDTGLPISRAPAYSVLFWVKGKGTGQVDARMFSESSSTVNDPLVNIGTHNTGADDTVDIFVRNSGTQINHYHSTLIGLDDEWHHIAWIDDHGEVRLYIDGQLDYTNTIVRGPTPYDTTSVGAILRAAPGSYFAGIIDEVALWERALSEDEIRDVKDNGIVVPVPEFPPAVVAQPVGADDLLVGDFITLTTRASGRRPFTYEWRKDGSALSGETGNSLLLTNLMTSDSGDYLVVVRNDGGAVTSMVARVVVSEAAGPNLTNGLVAFWPLEELSGTRTPDVVGGYDMNLVNLTEDDLVAGRWGQAFQFTASRSTMLERENLPEDELSLYTKHPDFTVSLWVNGPPFQQDKRIFSEASSTVNTPLFNLGTHNTAADGSVDVYIRDDANQQGGHRFSIQPAYDDTWHHVVYVQREVGGTMQAALYIDAVRDEVVLDPRRPLTASTTSIGGIRRGSAAAPARSFFFDGIIDDVALWGRALSDEEITLLFNEGTPRPSGPVTQPLVIRSFKADLPAVAQGDPVTLRWDVSADATGIEMDQGVGSVLAQSVAGVGHVAVPLSESRTFTLTVRRGDEVLEAQTTVAAIDGIAENWALIDNFDRYNPGPFPSTYWGDLGGNSVIANVSGNRMLDMRGTARVALLTLHDLTVAEGQQRTLFARIYVQGDPTAQVRSLIGLTDRSLRFVTDATDAGGVGPAALPSNESGELMIGARFGPGSARDFLPPVLEPGEVYNLWIDVRNNQIDVGDLFSIFIQREGDASRTELFVDYLSDRDPLGDPPGAGGAPTQPDLSRVFVGNNDANAVFFDDIYISKSGLNATIPRAFGFTTPVGGMGQLSLEITVTGGQLQISWPEGTLESAAAVTGPWSDVAGAAPPTYSGNLEGAQRFFRVRR
jgi:hypothetical protein